VALNQQGQGNREKKTGPKPIKWEHRHTHYKEDDANQAVTNARFAD